MLDPRNGKEEFPVALQSDSEMYVHVVERRESETIGEICKKKLAKNIAGIK